MTADRKRRMREVVHKEFVVDVPHQVAWELLERVESWPSWAKHIKGVGVWPRGPLMGQSRGTFRLAAGFRSTFSVEVYEPPRRWQWVGRFLTITVHYDHLFEPIEDDHTKLTWRVEATGAGTTTIGRVFARIYSRNLDRAIATLRKELHERMRQANRPSAVRSSIGFG
jgi:hypothetical protein